jgi:hypothetical protein
MNNESNDKKNRMSGRKVLYSPGLAGAIAIPRASFARP